jgi:cobalamin biosynthesis protein CbiD
MTERSQISRTGQTLRRGWTTGACAAAAARAAYGAWCSGVFPDPVTITLPSGGVPDVAVTIAIPGGAALAERTMNGRLGIVGGMLKYLRRHPVPRITVAGGFAKLAKLAAGHLDLHSARSRIDPGGIAVDATVFDRGGRLIGHAGP